MPTGYPPDDDRRSVSPTPTPLRVLIAEDDVVIGMLLTMMLTEMGWSVCSIAKTESDTIRDAARYRPDLIIADLKLRQGNGMDAVADICRQNFIPHVFVSRDTSQAQLRNPEAIMIAKLYNFTDLEQAVERALNPQAPA